MGKSTGVYPQNKILIVDDEQDILDVLVFALGCAGYDVDVASNGQMALDKVSVRDYDLIITDIRMPVMDGEAFYRELRSAYPHLSRRVIFCTGDAANPVTQCFLNTTTAPVFFKPFRLSAVLEVVSQMLAQEHTLVDVALPTETPLTTLDAVIRPTF